ncbi:MAG: DNA repair protein RadA [Bacteroidales bacterium]|nr:DNA repair protein RadA [Bacteroidales bacterium]
MAKTKTVFLCQNCGADSPRWIGHCPACNEWNTYVEEIIQKTDPYSPSSPAIQSKPKKLSEIEMSGNNRILTNNIEFNRLLGGGLVPGSLTLLGGEPGIGKSTMALQVALKSNKFRTLYVSGEESEQQIRLRADRIGGENDTCYILCETKLENILNQLEKINPGIVIIDSIQTVFSDRIESSPGSVSQVRESASRLLRFAKETGIPVILIGHITKDGNLAGPKVLEHIVDTVLYFEGDRNHLYRILRANKNRFGSTSELGIFEMSDKGLREVSNPSELLISHFDEDLSGVAISATLDGTRPFLIESQALVSSAVYGTPQRSSTGFDLRRLNMLLAVLEKRAGFKLASKDVFLNIAGGIKVSDPAIDLAVVSAILSSSLDFAVNKKKCFSAEVGLSGEIRPVSRIEQRITEAEKLGFEKIYISKFNQKGLSRKKYKIEIVAIEKMENLVKQLFH